jgi:Holliday junction resolvase RusA-like endonuclease
MYKVSPRGYLYKTPKCREFKTEIDSIMKELNPPKLHGPISLSLKFCLTGNRKKIDLDNMFKCVLDCIAPHICMFDDSQIYELHGKKIIGEKENKIVIVYKSLVDDEVEKSEFESFNLDYESILPI